MHWLVFCYNLFQIGSWSLLLALLVYYGATQPWDEFVCLYHDNANWRTLLEVAQGSAILDMVFSVLRMTPNSPMTVFSQIASRLIIIWMIFPNMPRPQPQQTEFASYGVINICAIAWAQSEIIRFTFYSF